MEIGITTKFLLCLNLIDIVKLFGLKIATKLMTNEINF